jgi:hypothetical protein
MTLPESSESVGEQVRQHRPVETCDGDQIQRLRDALEQQCPLEAAERSAQPPRSWRQVPSNRIRRARHAGTLALRFVQRYADVVQTRGGPAIAERSRHPLRALAILVVAAIGTFAVSTVAVSAMGASVPQLPAVQFPFSKFAFSGSVHSVTPKTTNVTSYALGFHSAFTLAAGSDGLVDPATNALGDVKIQQDVAYPVANPGGSVVGPVGLPFSSDTLSLIIIVRGSCFTKNAAGAFAFTGDTKCVTADLVLQGSSYDVSSLLGSVKGTFTPSSTVPGRWTGTIAATFTDPGYTFPVATLGPGGQTSFSIGNDGASGPTKRVAFGA